jgi:hypothetical protein
VYLPKYSITCFGSKKGRLAYTTQSLDITGLAMGCGIVICFRKHARNIVLKKPSKVHFSELAPQINGNTFIFFFQNDVVSKLVSNMLQTIS